MPHAFGKWTGPVARDDTFFMFGVAFFLTFYFRCRRRLQPLPESVIEADGRCGVIQAD